MNDAALRADFDAFARENWATLMSIAHGSSVTGGTGVGGACVLVTVPVELPEPGSSLYVVQLVRLSGSTGTLTASAGSAKYSSRTLHRSLVRLTSLSAT